MGSCPSVSGKVTIPVCQGSGEVRRRRPRRWWSSPFCRAWAAVYDRSKRGFTKRVGTVGSMGLSCSVRFPAFCRSTSLTLPCRGGTPASSLPKTGGAATSAGCRPTEASSWSCASTGDFTMSAVRLLGTKSGYGSLAEEQHCM